MRSPPSSFTTACTRAPLRPTQAPTGSTASSREKTAILVRLPTSREAGPDLDDRLLDLGHLELEQRLHEQGVRAAQDEARPLGGVLDALEHRADRLALVVVLAVVLLAVGDDRLRLAELVQHEHELPTLDLLHLAGEQLADLGRELVLDAGALALAHALHDALLGRLHRGAPELRERDLLLEDVAHLELGVLELRLLHRDLAGEVLRVLDHRLEQGDADLAGVVVDVDLGLHGRAVLLGQRREDAVLQQPVQLGAIELLRVRQLANRRENLCRSDHPGLLYLFQWNVSRAWLTSVSRRRCSAPRSSRTTATSSPASPSSATIVTSAFPAGSDGAVTTAVCPANRRQSPAPRRGRSIPGDDTSSTYFSPTKRSASSRFSTARETRAQSSTETRLPSRRSIRRSSTGRLLEPR
jgi:hypothetical protein